VRRVTPAQPHRGVLHERYLLGLRIADAVFLVALCGCAAVAQALIIGLTEGG
jgi:hypothetical protein